MRPQTSQGNTKTAIKGLLKNENISKLIGEAVNSAPGSTSRKRVQKMLGVLRKTGMMDGAGGPGLNIPKQNQRLQPQAYDYSNLVIFPSAPALRTSQPAPVMDGAGGPGFGLPLAFGSQDRVNQLTGGSSQSSSPTTYQSPYSQMFTGSQSSTPSTNESSGGGLFGRLPSFMKTAAKTASNALFPGLSQIGSAAVSGYNSLNRGGQQPAPAQEQNMSMLPQGGQSQMGGPGGQSMDEVIAAQQRAMAAQAGAYSGGGSSGGGETGGGISNKFPGIQSAVDSGMGPGMFAYQAMARGPEYLQNLPGFAGLPADALKGAPTLSGRIQDLDKALRSQYRLDEMLNQYMGLVDQGVGLEGRLTDYIRGRDEFLNETDGMLDDFKHDMLKMNLADPETRQSSQMYANYLYELRGRQNKRYIEFLNTSVDEYNNKLTSVQNMYTTALDGYQRELTMKSAVTQEEYNLMFGALSDMYNTVANAPLQALEMQKLQAEIHASNVRAAKDAADMYGTNREDIWEAAAHAKALGWVTEDHRINPNMSISDFSSYGSGGGDPTALLQVYNTSLKNSFNPDKDGNPMSLDQIMQTAGSAFSTFNNFAAEGMAAGNQDTYNFAESSKLGVRSYAAEGLFNNGVIRPESGTVVKQAVDYLANKDAKWGWGKGVPSRDKFLEDFKTSGLDSRLLGSLYNNFEGFKDNRSQFSTYYLNETQNGSVVRPYSEAELASKLAYDFTDQLGWGSQ